MVDIGFSTLFKTNVNLFYNRVIYEYFKTVYYKRFASASSPLSSTEIAAKKWRSRTIENRNKNVKNKAEESNESEIRPQTRNTGTKRKLKSSLSTESSRAARAQSFRIRNQNQSKFWSKSVEIKTVAEIVSEKHTISNLNMIVADI